MLAPDNWTITSVSGPVLGCTQPVAFAMGCTVQLDASGAASPPVVSVTLLSSTATTGQGLYSVYNAFGIFDDHWFPLG